MTMTKSAFALGLAAALAAAEMLNACSGDDSLVSDVDAGADATFGSDAAHDSGSAPADAGSDSGATLLDSGVDAGSDSGIVVVDSGPFIPFDAGPPIVLNGCRVFADDTASGVASLDWGFNIEDDPNHCAMIRPGQSVSWVGDVTFHPLVPYDSRDDGGVAGSPITIGSATGPSTITIQFPNPGLYGYWCMVHQTMMMGAIDVEPAPDLDAGDAGSDAGDAGDGGA